MKLSRYEDGSKAIEIKPDEDDNSKLSFIGDVTITTANRESGEVSSIAKINQHGSMDFVQLPQVEGVNLVLETNPMFNTTSKEITILDDSVTPIPISNAQEMITVLYSVYNPNVDEKGTIVITKHGDSYFLDITSTALTDRQSPISFSVSEDNNSLILYLSGNGEGTVTLFKYRVNSMNTLYM